MTEELLLLRLCLEKLPLLDIFINSIPLCGHALSFQRSSICNELYLSASYLGSQKLWISELKSQLHKINAGERAIELMSGKKASSLKGYLKAVSAIKWPIAAAASRNTWKTRICWIPQNKTQQAVRWRMTTSGSPALWPPLRIDHLNNQEQYHENLSHGDHSCPSQLWFIGLWHEL